MKKYSSTNASNNFGRVLNDCKDEPILITLSGRDCAVLVPLSEYQTLIDVENRFWGELAVLAEEVGFMADDKMGRWVAEKTGYSLNIKISTVAMRFLDALTPNKCENILNGILSVQKFYPKKILKLSGYKFKRYDFGKNRVICDEIDGTIRIVFAGERKA